MRKANGEDLAGIEKKKKNPASGAIAFIAWVVLSRYHTDGIRKRSNSMGMIIVSRGPNSNSRMLNSFIKDNA